MTRRVVILLISLLVGVGLFFWGLGQWPASLPDATPEADLLWRTIKKTATGWERSDFVAGNSTDLVSFQEGPFVLYGTKHIPDMILERNERNITFPKQGEWILRSLALDNKISFKLGGTSGIISGIGSVYFNSTGTIANIDAQVTVSGKSLLPSFLYQEGKVAFFDISEQTGLISPDLWEAYASFLFRDQSRALGDISRAYLDSMIRTLINREPDSSGVGLFRSDLRAKNALEEIKITLVKMDKDDSCGTESDSCKEIIDNIIDINQDDFPEVFLPFGQAFHAWYQIESPEVGELTWENVFRTYHLQLLKNDPRARTIRDKSLLDMTKKGATSSDIATWSYLAQMLKQEKNGSAYSLQIIREMMRIGDELYQDKNTSAEMKETLAKDTLEALTNLKNVIENTYFTKKEYWFVLRDDLVDSEGGVIQNQIFIRDLQELIKQIDASPLLLSQKQENKESLATIRAQLVWFNCIFSRNAEYITNPRICRTTRTT